MKFDGFFNHLPLGEEAVEASEIPNSYPPNTATMMVLVVGCKDRLEASILIVVFQICLISINI